MEETKYGLPSDEAIEEKTEIDYVENCIEGEDDFFEGAKWMRQEAEKAVKNTAIEFSDWVIKKGYYVKLHLENTISERLFALFEEERRKK